jgi:hypothetical protein
MSPTIVMIEKRSDLDGNESRLPVEARCNDLSLAFLSL